MRYVNYDIIQLRKTRKLIRRLVNLVGDGKKIREWPGTWWRADMEKRRVEWTPLWPIDPYPPIDNQGLRYLVAHEASHIKWSGLYETKTIPEEHKGRFHRFVNAIEDIRVDRLSERQFAGFHKVKVYVRRKLRAGHGDHPQGWSLWDAVGLNAIYAFDIGLNPEGTELAVEASTRLWPRLDRIANSRSTQEVATALEPIFMELMEIQEQQQKEEEEQEGEGDPSGDPGGSGGNPGPGGQGEPSESDQDGDGEEAEGSPGPGGQPGESKQGGGKGSSEPESGEEEGEDDFGGGPARGDTEGDSSDESEAADGGGKGSDEESADDEAGDEDEAGGGSGGGSDESDAQGDAEGEGDVDGEQGEGQDGDGNDPLAGLDDLPDDAGADEPTQAPVKSKGAPGTEPLAIGEDLEGMAEDALEQDAQSDLERLARGHLGQKQQMQEPVDMQLGKRHPSTVQGEMAYADRKKTWKGKINVLSQRLKTVLRHNSMTHPQTGQRRGRFDPGKAYRLRTGDIKIFQKPGTVGGLDYTFGILVDTSGSMWSDQSYEPGSYGQPKTPEIEGAFDSVVLIAESLEAAKLPFFLIFWDEDLTHFKPLEEPLHKHEGPIGTVCGAYGGGASTIEAPAIGLALEEFEKVQHGQRLLICITDGGTSTIEQSKELLGELEDQGVHTCTIRIGDDPAEHYEKGYSVDHADELTRLLPQLINEVVQRV